MMTFCFGSVVSTQAADGRSDRDRQYFSIRETLSRRQPDLLRIGIHMGAIDMAPDPGPTIKVHSLLL